MKAAGMDKIRRAQAGDASRIAEVLIFTKRVNYRHIFQNDQVSFGEMQVLPLAREYLEKPELLENIWVYDDGFVKGMVHVEGREIAELYVDSFFQSGGIGGALMEFAVQRLGARELSVLEKNPNAIKFYERHGFRLTGERRPEEGTAEYVLRMEYKSCQEEKPAAIRKAGPVDVEDLRELYRELEEDGVRYQPEHFVAGYREDSFFQNIFASGTQDILAAETGGRVVGFSHVMILEQKQVACLKPETLVYIQDLDVRADMRGQGIGTALIEASKEYGIMRGAGFIRTQVFPQNRDGIRFYERGGFREMMKTIECPLP